MPIETRFMRSDQHTINGLLAYKLLTSESAALLEHVGCTVTTAGQYFYIGIRVYVRHADSSETEITPGTSVATASMDTDGDFTMNTLGTWDCPETAMVSTDAIKIDVRCCCGVAWDEGVAITIATFITEQLGAESLDAAEWLVSCRVRRDKETFMGVDWWDYYFRHGIVNIPMNGDYSYITNFCWTPAPPPVARHILMDGLICVVYNASPNRGWQHGLGGILMRLTI